MFYGEGQNPAMQFLKSNAEIYKTNRTKIRWVEGKC